MSFQSDAFQNNAFQVYLNANTNGGGHPAKEPYSYHSPYRKLEEELRAKLKREKTELEKLESVLAEAKRKKALAEESRLEAKRLRNKQNVLRLQQLEKEYLGEINRLLAVRAGLMLQISKEESLIVLLMMMRRRKLNAA